MLLIFLIPPLMVLMHIAGVVIVIVIEIVTLIITITIIMV